MARTPGFRIGGDGNLFAVPAGFVSEPDNSDLIPATVTTAWAAFATALGQTLPQRLNNGNAHASKLVRSVRLR